MLHWIIQNSPYEEEGHYALRRVLDVMDIPHTEVKIIPFSHEITPDPQVENPVVVMGTISLAETAQKRGWTPGAWTNDDFNYTACIDHYRDNMLNGDGIVCEFGNVNSPWNEFFIRPLYDGKEFAGKVMSFVAQELWAESVKEIEQTNYTTIDSSTPVLVAPLKDIQREYRFFVVDGVVVTGSRYKIGERVIYSTELDGAEKYAQKMVDMWQPAEAFVLDIALVNDEFKIIEINCLNSAGFYAIEVDKLVQAIMNLY